MAGPGRHAEVLALYGHLLAIGLMFASLGPMVLLGFGPVMAAAAGMYVLTGVVFVGQGAMLSRSPDRYVGRHVVPWPVKWIEFEGRVAVYVWSAFAFVFGGLFAYIGFELLRAVARLPG